jgi:hypothetical protein
MGKKIYEVTAEEYIDINSANGVISKANALMAIMIERCSKMTPEEKKIRLIHGIKS